MNPLAFFHHACVDGSNDASNCSEMEPTHSAQKTKWQRLVRRFSLPTLSVMVPFVAIAVGPAMACNCGNGYIRPVSYGYTAPVSYSGYPQLGSSGPEVTAIQRQLNRNGYPVAVDGLFGPSTDQAVRSFQSANGLAVDGIVGPSTRQALISGGGTVYRPVSYPTYPQNPPVYPTYPQNPPVYPYYPPNPPIANVPPMGGPTWSSNNYVVVIPSSNGSELYRVRQYAPSAYFVSNDPRGSFINAGTSPQRGWANQQSDFLRRAGFDARVVYFR